MMALPVSLNVTYDSARPKSISAHFYLNEIPILFVYKFIYLYGSNTTFLNLSARSLSQNVHISDISPLPVDSAFEIPFSLLFPQFLLPLCKLRHTPA